MTDNEVIKFLKIVMAIGIILILLGHYLLTYTDITQTMGIAGIMLSAGCIAIGLAMSLPTKMYLTFIFVKNENERRKAQRKSK